MLPRPPNTPVPVTSTSASVSPGKKEDLRMKDLQQLRYLQQLLEDNMITDLEFAEQKS